MFGQFQVQDCEMENESKSSELRYRDRLSELHESLIFNIFEYLPMKYVVRTQILSHRWKNLWTLTPFLFFQNEIDGDNIEFRKFVNQALLSWRGTRVHKFKVSGIAFEHIDIDNDDEIPLFTDIDSWLRFAVDNGVEELDLSSEDYQSSYYRHYCVPQFLYSCSSLKKLSLTKSSIEISGFFVQWSQLLSLTIEGFQVTARVVKEILRGSPRLEVFNLYFEESVDSKILNIRSSSLKELSICKVVGDHDDDEIVMDTELGIWTPNLVSLTIKGMPYQKCLLKDVSSLTHVTLWFYELYYFIDLEDYGFSANEYLEGTLSQILPSIQHVEGLTLSDWCIQMLSYMNTKSLLAPFSDVKLLSLNGKYEEVVRILGLLEMFPKLETLVIKEDDSDFYVERNLKFKWKPSMYFLDELRTVEVIWNQWDFSTFPFIQSLLSHATELERMAFRVKKAEPGLTPPPQNTLLLASKKLCRMPRSSPSAELIICDN